MSSSPLLIGEQLVSLKPGGDSGVMGEAVLGTGRLQRTDLGQNVKFLRGEEWNKL